MARSLSQLNAIRELLTHAYSRRSDEERSLATVAGACESDGHALNGAMSVPTAVMSASVPPLMGRFSVEFELGARSVDLQERAHGTLYVAAYRKGRRYGFGVVREVCGERNGYETAEGWLIHPVGADGDDFHIVGRVFRLSRGPRDAWICADGVQLEDRGFPVFESPSKGRQQEAA